MRTERGFAIAGVVTALMSAAAPAQAIPLDECFELGGEPEGNTCTTPLEVTQEECEGGDGDVEVIDVFFRCSGGQYDRAEVSSLS